MKKIILLMVAFTLVLTVSLQPSYASVEIDANLDFSDKKIVFLGDSITLPWPVETADGFAALVSGELGFGESVNYGTGSSTIADQVSNNYSFVERYSTMDNDADYVIVFGGINDYKYDSPMGATDSITLTDFNGALNEMYSGLITRYYPNATIFVLTPLSSRFGADPDTVDNGVALGLDDYVQAMKDRAIDGINIIDLYTMSNMNMATSDTDEALYTSDGHHPNERGHRRIADILISIIGGENLFTMDGAVTGSYFNVNDGSSNSLGDVSTTDFIEVEEGRDYISYASKFHADSYVSGDTTIAHHHTFWDRARVFVEGAGSIQEHAVFNVPVGARSIRVIYYDGTEAYQSLREIKNYIQVDFEMNEANSTQDSLKVEAAGATISEPATPIKMGEEFLGWFTDTYLTEQYDFDDDVVTDDITLYAKWTDADVTDIAVGTITAPSDTFSFLGLAWYYWGAIGGGVYFVLFTKKGRKAFGLK